MDRLSAISAFVAVADANGFAAAARKLKVSPSAITRMVAALEEHLGIRLLTRTTRSVAVTDGGARFLERARRLVADLEDAEGSARRERARPTGRLTVGAPVIFGRLHAAPALADFLDRYPDVTAELQLTDRAVNLVEEGVDVAVRIGELSDSTMVVRRVGSTRRVLVAAPKYLRTAPKLEAPADLARHRLIAFTALAPGREWTFHRNGEELRVPVRPRLATNAGDAAIGFALRGGGVTLALGYQVAEAIRERALRVVLADSEPPASPIHLAWPTSRLLSAKVRAFVELVAKTARWDFTGLG